MTRKTLPKPEAIRADALALYVAAYVGTVLSPIDATKELAARYGYGTDATASPVAAVFYAENGRRFPLPISPETKTGDVRKAVRKRRDYPGETEGGISADGRATLGRWETVAASASAALGRRVSVAEAKRLYVGPSGDVADTGSYAGRGTYAGAASARDAR